MMIESMAGKSAAMHGLCHDATPFTFSEDRPAIDYFGRMLTSGIKMQLAFIEKYDTLF
jgi:DNA-directed RNA polymerase I subunit RPA2